MRRACRSGFTLVEIIVVLGIIIMLAGLLFPLIGRFKESAKRVQCLNNLRSLTQAWIAYAGDNERHLCSSNPQSPPGWVNKVAVLDPQNLGPIKSGRLWPYLNDTGLYRCPDDTTNPTINPVSYAANGLLNGPLGNPFTYARLDDIPNPSKTFVFIEQAYPLIARSPDNPNLGGVNPNLFSTPLYPNPPVLRVTSWPGQNHKGNKAYAEGTGISFADGHAIFWQYADTRTGNLQESFAAGLNGSLYTNGSLTPPGTFPFLTNSPDVFQLMAWSGGPLPPDPPKLYDPTKPWP